MSGFKRILVFHPSAIGDAVLATPVSMTLRKNFPGARILYMTHPSLIPLLRFCPAVDEAHAHEKESGIIRQFASVRNLKPDLIVDLSGSVKSFQLTAFAGAKNLHYRKQSRRVSSVQHAVDNYLSTLQPLSLVPLAAKFPTLYPDDKVMKDVAHKLLVQVATEPIAGGCAEALKLIGLVPGVGRLRCHRAWSEQGWLELASRVLAGSEFVIALIGGEDESALCQRIAEAAGSRCLNMAGRLSLPETAALLKNCHAVVSADTGPAHIAVAVGTPVVGLLGPTLVQRSGPYGMERFTVDHSHSCRCQRFKSCRVTAAPGPGYCMQGITADEVWAKLQEAMSERPVFAGGGNDAAGSPGCSPSDMSG